MAEQRKWTVPCRDAMGRERRMTVAADSAGAVLLFPPPTSAALELRHVHALLAVLDFADNNHQTTADAPGFGGECTAGLPGGGASTLSHPAVPELAAASGPRLLLEAAASDYPGGAQ